MALDNSGAVKLPTSSLHETPSKQRISNHASVAYTHKSVDSFIRDDLNGLTRRDVPLDIFLSMVLGFKETEWGEKIRNLGLHDDPKYKELSDDYQKLFKMQEELRYLPFARWANYITEQLSEQLTGVRDSIDLSLHPLGRKILKGDFGNREPDIAASNGSTTANTIDWNAALFVIEFKKKYLKRKMEEAVQSGSVSNKAKISGGIGSKVSDSKPAAKKASSLRVNRTGSSRSRQSSSKPIPAAPGYNRPSPANSPVP